MLKDKRFIKIATVFTICIIYICTLAGCKSETKEYEQPVRNLVEAVAEADSEKFLSAFPSFIAEDSKNIFTKEYMENVLEELEETHGSNIQRTIEIKKDKKISKDELKKTQSAVSDIYNAEFTIEEGRQLDVKIKTKGDKSEDIEEHTFYVYKIEGKWYLFSV